MKLRNWNIYIVSSITVLGILFNSIMAQPVPALLNFNGSIASYANMPGKLSETGFDPGNTEVFVPYEVNAPRWINLMKTDHYVYVPDNTRIMPGNTLDYVFPVGTVFFKIVYLETIYNDPSTRINIECQIQVRNSDTTFNRLTYFYDEDQTDAVLVDTLTFIEKTYDVMFPEGITHYVKPDGSVAKGATIELIRTPYDCSSCHSNKSASGFFTQQLNIDNQLIELKNKGILISVPDSANMESENIIFQWFGINDSSETQEKRVRSGLAGNCSICHNNAEERLTLSSIPSFEYFQDIPVESTGWWGLIVPGNPNSSILYHSTENHFHVDVEFKLLLWDWINSLDKNRNNDIPYPGDTVVNIEGNMIKTGRMIKAFLRDGILRVNIAQDKNVVVKLFTLNGREIKIKKISESRYKTFYNLEPGLYVARVNEKTILLRSFKF